MILHYNKLHFVVNSKTMLVLTALNDGGVFLSEYDSDSNGSISI